MMTKALRIAKVSAKGGFSLFLGVSLSSIISAVGTIVLVRLLTPAQYGLYTIALMPPAVFIMFRDWGIGAAMIKHLAQYRSENRTAEMEGVLISGMLFELAAGDIGNLRQMLTELGPFFHLFNLPLSFIEKLTTICVRA